MTSLHHVLEGSGPTVLLLHAGVADLRMWDGLAATLATDHRVLRCDLRGFGGTLLEPGAAYSDAEDVLALLECLGIARFALVGASHGGHVALQVATAVPEQVTAMVLLAPAADLAEPDERLRATWREEERLLADGDLDGAADLTLAAWLGPEADEATRAAVHRMQRDALVLQTAAGEVEARDLAVRPETLSVPTTVLVGAHDFAFFDDTARALVAALPQATLRRLPWAGHLPVLERPEQAAVLVAEALGGTMAG